MFFLMIAPAAINFEQVVFMAIFCLLFCFIAVRTASMWLPACSYHTRVINNIMSNVYSQKKKEHHVFELVPITNYILGASKLWAFGTMVSHKIYFFSVHFVNGVVSSANRETTVPHRAKKLINQSFSLLQPGLFPFLFLLLSLSLSGADTRSTRDGVMFFFRYFFCIFPFLPSSLIRAIAYFYPY